jgi:uncharacterized protein YndB with AHSA1/START domain
MTITTVTGRKESRQGLDHLVLTRTFTAPVADVWAAITEPERLARWIGSWSGDPAEGRVTFQMLYEGDEMPAEDFVIDECTPPSRLLITTTSPHEDGTPMTWQLGLELAETDGITTLQFSQSVPDPSMAEGVGPGWEYYLDRMVAAETGADVATIQFEDYYPALSQQYREIFE